MNPTAQSKHQWRYKMTELSKSLIASIPKKTVTWLNNLHEDLTDTFTRGSLRVTVTELGGEIQLTADELIQIYWEGDATDPLCVTGDNKKFENLEMNLDWFANVEDRIYTEIQRHEDDLYDRELRVHREEI